MDPLYKEFGLLLKARRSEARITQDEMASKVGLGRTSITNIEQGKQPVSLQMLYQLADALGMTPQELLPSEPKAFVSEEIERNLSQKPLNDDEKNWVRRIVLKAPPLESATTDDNT